MCWSCGKRFTKVRKWLLKQICHILISCIRNSKCPLSENLCKSILKLLNDIVILLIEVVHYVTQEFIISNSACLIRESCTLIYIWHGSGVCGHMSRCSHAILHAGLLLRQEFLQSLPVIYLWWEQYLLHKLYRIWKFLIESFHRYIEELLDIRVTGISNHIKLYSTYIAVYLIWQLSIGVLLRVNIFKQAWQHSKIWHKVIIYIIYIEIEPQISYTVCKYIVAYNWKSADLRFNILKLFSLFVNVIYRQKWNLGKIFGWWRGCLILLERLCILHDLLKLLTTECSLVCSQLISDLLLVLLVKPLLWIHSEIQAKCIVNETFLYDLFKITILKILSQLLIHIIHLKKHECLGIVIKPAVKCIQSVHKPLRKPSKIGLLVLELKLVDCSLNRILIYTMAEFFKRVIYYLYESVLIVLIRASCYDRECGLLASIVKWAVDLLAYTRISQSFLQDSSRRIHEHVLKYFKGCNLLLFGAEPCYLAVCEYGIVLLWISISYGVLHSDILHLVKWLLKRDRWIYLLVIVMWQILLIYKFQLLRHITITIQINITVRWMIICPVEISESLKGECRYGYRITAWIIAIWSVRHEWWLYLSVHNRLRTWVHALHLIVHNSVVLQVSVHRVKLIVPALLLHDLIMYIDIRIEHCIQIHTHDVLKVLLIEASYRIYRLVWISHGVQKGVQRTFCQLNKWILYRIFLWTTKHWVLNYMRYSWIIIWRCPEAYIKHLIHIVILNDEDPCLCLYMLQHIALAMYLWKILLLNYSVSLYILDISQFMFSFYIFYCPFICCQTAYLVIVVTDYFAIPSVRHQTKPEETLTIFSCRNHPLNVLR